MAQIFRRPPAATATQERPKARPSTNGSGGGATGNNLVGRTRNNIETVLAELRKVTWPTREETRNLTIVVIAISVFLGLLLGGIDQLLFALYNLINH